MKIAAKCGWWKGRLQKVGISFLNIQNKLNEGKEKRTLGAKIFFYRKHSNYPEFEIHF